MVNNTEQVERKSNLEVLNASCVKSKLNLYVEIVYSVVKLMIIFIQQNFCTDKASYSTNKIARSA